MRSIAGWETGQTIPRADQLRALAIVLDLPCSGWSSSGGRRSTSANATSAASCSRGRLGVTVRMDSVCRPILQLEFDPLRDKSYAKTALGRSVVDFLAWKRIGKAPNTTLDTYEWVLSRGCLMFPKLDARTFSVFELMHIAASFPDASRANGWPSTARSSSGRSSSTSATTTPATSCTRSRGTSTNRDLRRGRSQTPLRAPARRRRPHAIPVRRRRPQRRGPALSAVQLPLRPAGRDRRARQGRQSGGYCRCRCRCRGA